MFLVQQEQEDRGGKYKITLKCPWQKAITDLYSLSVSGSIEGVKVDYAVVKDFCKKYDLDPIETLSDIRHIVYEVRQLKEED